MVLYRKYRPQKLIELDLVSVRERLINILSSNYVPHAFLFCGPKGTGKTSAARIIAKILNCETLSYNQRKRPLESLDPCNKCETCLSITAGRNIDVLEIDAASNRGIDEIRELRDKIKLAPVSSAYKVYIIDEVHMLTNEAFNALLKILEEPPLHAFFILATTQPEKLLETITSRCVKIVFHKATDEEIKHALNRVAKGEKIKVSEQALFLLSQFSDGSFRDATKLLEQAISENALEEDKLASLLGGDNFSAEKFLLLLLEKDSKKVLEEIYQMAQKGADFRFFISQLLNYLHQLLLSSYQVIKLEKKPDQLNNITVKEINSLIRLFLQVYADIKFASRAELPLEVAAVEWCEKER